MTAIGLAGWLGLLAIALAGPSLGADPEPREAIDAIKEYQRSLGLKPTGNFRKHSNKTVAEYRCYYTGKLELPASYDDLRIKDGSEKECPVDAARYDVFFYPVEAVASGDAPVTSKLAEAGRERLLMVVIHEDFHQHHEKSKLPAAVTEAASTLMAFITASGFATEQPRHGQGTAEQLARDADVFLEKARMINRYYAEAAELYQLLKDRHVSEDAALDRKKRLFERLGSECRAMAQRPASFSTCPGALNNAGLAFDYTYTKHYPLLYELFASGQKDLRTTLASLQEILAMPLRTERDFMVAVRARIAAAE